MARRSLSALVLIPTLALTLVTACRPSEPERETANSAATPAPAPMPSPAPPLASGSPAPMGTPAAPGALPQGPKLTAGILVLDGVYNTELAAPFDVLQHTKYHVQPGVQVFTVSPDGQAVTTFEGLKLTPDYAFANAPAIDILVVPSGGGSMDRDLQDAPVIDWLRKTGGQARNILSFCDASFLLAKAGLLDGQPATTFPDDYGRFSQMFPNVDLRINVSYVDAGKVITSQGGARSFEATLQLVDRVYGHAVAEQIGKGLLVAWPPTPATAREVVPGSTPAPTGTATPSVASPAPMETASPGQL
jgi:transcriptional regulator GlxA family with amidase domain